MTRETKKYSKLNGISMPIANNRNHVLNILNTLRIAVICSS